MRVVIEAAPEELAQLITSLMSDGPDDVTDVETDTPDDVTDDAPDMEPDDAWWRNADTWRYDP